MKSPAIKSRDQFDAVIDDLVEKQLQKERIEIERDKQILALREIFDAGKDDGETPGLKELSEAIAANLAMAGEYAAAKMAGEKGETSFADFGFRTGPPSLSLLDPKSTWDKVVAAIKLQFKKKAGQFIRVKEEPDKAAIKNHLDDAQRKAIGTVLERKETFFVDPKRDPSDPHRLVAAPPK